MAPTRDDWSRSEGEPFRVTGPAPSNSGSLANDAFVEKRTFAAAEPLLPLPPLGYDAFDESAARGGCDDCNQLAMAVRRCGRFLRQVTAGDGLPNA
jgi:hypothetical protein